MKTKELRDGNYIDGSNFHIEESPGIYQYKPAWYRYSHLLKPIPLTDQWFKDLGFKQDETKRIWGKDGIMLIRKLKRLPFCLPGYDNSICKYVHQLQNLYFVLKGKELTKR